MVEAIQSPPQKLKHVLLAVPKGLLLETLVTFLATLPEIKVSLAVHDLPSLVGVETAESAVDVIVLDITLAGEQIQYVLSGLQDAFPEAQRIVLVDGPQQQRQVLGTGADLALLKGYLGKALADALSQTDPNDESCLIESNAPDVLAER